MKEKAISQVIVAADYSEAQTYTECMMFIVQADQGPNASAESVVSIGRLARDSE